MLSFEELRIFNGLRALFRKQQDFMACFRVYFVKREFVQKSRGKVLCTRAFERAV